jgi:vacuolar-type H+-ATPase subunit H
MDDESKEQVSQEILEQRRQIESYEITTKAETLAARMEVADEIQQAENEARQKFETEKAIMQGRKEDFLGKAKTHFETLLGEIKDKEEKRIKEIEDLYRQREDTVLEKLLQTILP